MPIEMELKLDTTQAGSDALLAAGIAGDAQNDITLEAVYFDTPDRALHRNGLSLRIREQDGRAIQAVKAAGGGGGLFTRGEWECTVDGPWPVADPALPIASLLGAHFANLAALFTVRVQRRRRRIEVDGSVIELAIDRGEVLAGERCERFHEVELELVSGQRGALFDLARQFELTAPLRIGVLAKAERGYRLLDALAGAIRAEPPALSPAMAPSAAFAAIVGSCLRQYRLNEEILLRQPASEPIHQARVALRRLRAAFALFKALRDKPESAVLDRGLRDLARTLGEARDLDVLCRQAPAGALRDALAQAREAALPAVAAALAGPARALMLALAQWLDEGPWRDPAAGPAALTPLPVFAAAALDRLYRKARRHGRHLARLDDEARHRLRKDAKTLRYAAESLASLFDDDRQRRHRKTFLKALQRLQDALGALNDSVVAGQRLTALGLADAPQAEALLAAWDHERLIEEAARAHRALFARKPFWA